ncbi:type I-D CRISPR-associated helicase Cas3' [Orenia metallireducens]|uniref:Type I-D CRISPR-associated helicase Cas3 n=1 Tax=Orenia metallireducens TaxID=1413210 RepID=A0A1C0A894_9FIRM|nr:type I-D CRISPR-associated helicase Cas3' [Orenia metallireducens]OCL26483.1 type I-D CRISPR-associated helicase Cas3' [Orenia metallireducens]
MESIKIKLVEKRLKLVDGVDYVNGFNPYLHQYQTLEAFKEVYESKRSLAIFNYTSTGGGKTLASFAPALLYKQKAIGVYSTNELIKDQWSALEKFVDDSTRLCQLDSLTISQWKEDFSEFGYSIEMLKPLFESWSDIVLTNPDILYLIMFGLYRNKNYSAEAVFREIISKYPIIIFDEFHLYDIKQIANIAWMIGMIDRLELDIPHFFVFSSATPNSLFLEQLDRIGMDYLEIPHDDENIKYKGERIVMEGLDLELIPADLEQWKALEAVEDNLNLIDNYLKEYPDARGVFILDSVGDACQLADRLTARYDIEVGEVHGYKDKFKRREGLSKKFTVGTSTIEVGIDFKDDMHKDFMVFEAKSASQFMQRLGRLGRGGRREDEISTPNYVVAIVPVYVYNYFKGNLGYYLELNREELAQELERIYHSNEDFKPYLDKYAPIEAYYARNWILSQNADDTYSQERRRTKDLMMDLYSCGNLQVVQGNYNKLKKDKTLGGLLTFRGGGLDLTGIDDRPQINLDTAIIDNREIVKGNFPAKVYNLLWILKKCNFRLISRSSFMDELELYQGDFPEEIKVFKKSLEKRKLDFFVKVDAFREENRNIIFTLPDNQYWRRDKISNLGDLELKVEKGDKPEKLAYINEILEEKRAVAYITKGNSWGFSKANSLPPMFQVYPLKFISSGGIIRRGDYVIAFDSNAFLLDSLKEEEEGELLFV